MPDFTIEIHPTCNTNLAWETKVQGSDPKQQWTVRWSNLHKHSDRVEYDWSCTCPAYTYRPGYCKHIKLVQEKKVRCGWDGLIDGGATQDGTCPKCKGPTTPMRHAV